MEDNIFELNALKAQLVHTIEKGSFVCATPAIEFLTYVIKEIEANKEALKK